MSHLSLELWSDVACPWCWVGKRRLDEALASSEVEVRVRWRAFELDPTAPAEAPPSVDYVGRLATKYGTPRADAEAMIERMVAAGREAGVELRFDRIRPSSTFDAHRLLAWAGSQDLQHEVAERFFAAYLREGRSMSDHETLGELVEEAGLDREEARRILVGKAWADEVRRDQRAATGIGVSGVPFFVLDRRLALSGAQPAEVLREAMRRAVEGAKGSIDPR